MKKILLILSVAFLSCSGVSVAGPEEDSRTKHFEDSNYSMFIHWGLYSMLGSTWNGDTYYGISEWIMNPSMAHIPVDQYMALAKDFNPTGFDADAIAKLARDAGMKYIIITSKHHEGFAMFRSQANAFNICDATPFGRDPMKELAEACRKYGIGLGFYYSHNFDWTYPGATGGPETDRDGNKKTFDDYYHEKCLPQIEEITTNYGDLELVWFDMPGGIPEKYARELVEVVHRNQPRALVSSRVGYGLGDYETHGDSEIPLRNIDGIWESIDMTNRSWGYSWYDSAWKTPKDILSSLLSVIARGGSYMLNVGPDGQGRIPEAAQLSLLSAGKWISRHPDVVYGTDPSPWDHALPWGDAITKDDKLHLVVYQWPVDGKLWLHGLKNPVKEARVQGGTRKNKLKYTTEGDWTCLEVPFKAPDDPVSVIDLTVVGEPMADTTQFVDPGIGLTLSTMMAKAENCSVKKMAWMDSKFGDWKYAYGVKDWNEDARVTWEFVIKDPGYYQIALKYKGNERKVWKISTDEGRFIQNQQNASAVYTTYPIGWIKFDRPGRHTLQVGMVDGFKETNLIEFSITPVRF